MGNCRKPSNLSMATSGSSSYPDAVKRRAERRRQDWYHAYIKSIVERDIPEIADIAGREQIPRLLEICARFAGQLTNLSEIGRAIGRDHKAVGQYLRVLEQIYLVQSLLPWSRNELSRLVRIPKLHFSFVQGILLYDGAQTLSFGKSLRAAPLPTLWA